MLWWRQWLGIFVILWGFDRLKFSILIPLLHNVLLASSGRIAARRGRWQRHTNNHPKAQGEMMVEKKLEKLEVWLEEKFLNQLSTFCNTVISLFRHHVIQIPLKRSSFHCNLDSQSNSKRHCLRSCLFWPFVLALASRIWGKVAHLFGHFAPPCGRVSRLTTPRKNLPPP